MAEGSPNIEVLGWVNDETLCDLMGRCISTIYIPRHEDFGISPVESMAAGKPVIGVQEGALFETVGEGPGAGSREQGAGRGSMITDCGVLVPRDPGINDIVEAVEWMTPERAFGMRRACEARASRFDTNVFLQKMRDVIEGRG